MKKYISLLALAAFLFSGVNANAFWGSKSENLPDRRDVVQKALLWAPDTKTLDWELLRSFLERRNNARFTLALAPEDIPEESAFWLSELAAENKIEIALRIPGDPILPLASQGRSRLAAEKVALSRLRYKKLFGFDPAGFVPGGGALRPSDAKPLPRFGVRWAAVGDGEFSNAWYGDEQLILVPFHLILSTDTDQLPPATDTAALVIDESAGGVPSGSGLALLEYLVNESGDEAYTTVSAGLAAIRPYVVGPESWPSWRGDLAFWNESSAQQKAWELYHAAAKEVRSYQNSGSASIQRLNKAEMSLTQARAARNFVESNLRNPAFELAFRKALIATYKAIRKPAPKILRKAIAVPQLVEGETPQEIAPQVPSDNELIVEVQADRLTFSNPEKSMAAVPLMIPELTPDTTAAHLWTPRSLEVGWNENAVDFRISITRLEPSEQATFGFDHLLVDLYIDLNHLSGRGSTALLSRRKGFLEPVDAWEYVLVVSGSEGGLYRSLPGHPPSQILKLEPDVDLENGTLTLSVPRSRLRGNPAAWGYVLTTMMPGQKKPAFGPPRPAAGETGSPLLGMLGSLDEQRDLTTKRKSTYRRFAAQRAGRTNN